MAFDETNDYTMPLPLTRRPGAQFLTPPFLPGPAVGKADPDEFRPPEKAARGASPDEEAPTLGQKVEPLPAEPSWEQRFQSWEGRQPQSADYQPKPQSKWGRLGEALAVGAVALRDPQTGAAIARENRLRPYEQAQERYGQARQAWEDEGRALGAQEDQDLKGAQIENIRSEINAREHPVAKEGLTPEEQTIHDLMAGQNGQPRINPDTGKPYTALEAFRAVQTPQKTGLTPAEQTFHDLMSGNSGKARINPDTNQPYTPLEALRAVAPTPQDANKLAGEIEAQVGARPTTATWNGKKYPSVSAAQAAWGKQAEQIKNQEAAAGAEARGQAYGANRPVSVIDTWNGNRPVTVSAREAEDNPERYATAGPAEKALPREALINDIRVSAQNVGKNLGVLDSGGIDRAKLATSLADPNSTFQSYLQGIPRGELSDEQQEFVADLFNLREQAMALRTVLGAGQGSEDMRRAILDTLPSIASNSSLARKQLGNLQAVLNRVERGVPNVPLNSERGKTYTDAEVRAAVKAHPGMTAKQIESAYKAKGYTKAKAQ